MKTSGLYALLICLLVSCSGKQDEMIDADLKGLLKCYYDNNQTLTTCFEYNADRKISIRRMTGTGYVRQEYKYFTGFVVMKSYVETKLSAIDTIWLNNKGLAGFSKSYTIVGVSTVFKLDKTTVNIFDPAGYMIRQEIMSAIGLPTYYFDYTIQQGNIAEERIYDSDHPGEYTVIQKTFDTAHVSTTGNNYEGIPFYGKSSVNPFIRKVTYYADSTVETRDFSYQYNSGGFITKMIRDDGATILYDYY
jgi:hypothetical protein